MPKGSKNNETENNDGSRSHEVDRIEKNLFSNHAPRKRATHSVSSGIDDPTRGGRINNLAKEMVNKKFKVKAQMSESGPDRKLCEQDSNQINWHLSTDEVNDDHMDSKVNQNPDSKIGLEQKETDKNLRDGYENINIEDDKCSITIGGKILGKEYRDRHDSIDTKTNNNESHKPTPVSGALGDDILTHANVSDKENVQVTIGMDLEPKKSNHLEEYSKEKLESHGELQLLSVESDFDDTIFNDDIDHLVNTESP